MARIRKKRNKTKWTLKILWLIFLLVLVGFIFKVWQSINRSLWDGQNQLNLAFNSQPVFLASFNPQGKSLNVLLIPQGTFIETLHGYGPCRVESIYRLGELNKKGGELFQGSLQEYLGIPVDGYAVISNFQLPISNSAKERKNSLSKLLLELLKKGETNLTKWDLVRLWWDFRNLHQEKINLVDLGQTSASQEVELPDGTKATKIDNERLVVVTSQLFADEKIKEEDLTVAVLNATDHPGLANKIALLIKNMGAQVVNIGEAEKLKSQISKAKCQVRSQKKEKNSYTVQKLKKTLNCEWGGEDLENQRSDVVLIVGEGYWEKLNLP